MNTRIYTDRILSNVRSHLYSGKFKYITHPKFVFLCGKGIDPNSSDRYEQTNRGIIGQYLKKMMPDVRIVLSESIWDQTFEANIDLLSFEEFLAEVSDLIILFVESPGSFCELGAFAYADKLFNDKMIIVMDQQYRDSKSFIASGPVLKAQKENAKVIYADIDHNMPMTSSELLAALNQFIKMANEQRVLMNKREIGREQVKISSFIIEFLELLRLFQPVSQDDLLSLYKQIKEIDFFEFVKRDGQLFHQEIKLKYIINLLKTAELITQDERGLRLVDYTQTQQLMLNYEGYGIDSDRSKVLCRKYRYGEGI